MPYPPVDGGAIATLNMITGFANAGHSVTVLAMNTPKHFTKPDQIPQTLKTNIQWEHVFVDTTIKPIKALFNLLFSTKPYNAVRFISSDYSSKLKHLLSNDFDIIQLEGLYLSPYINIIRNYSKTLISLRSHNVEWKIWKRLANNEKNVAKKFYYKTLAKRIKKMEHSSLKEIDLLVPITEQDQKELPFSNTNNVFVSQTGIIKQNISKSTPKNKHSLFYIGALDWIPNQEGLKWFITNVWNTIQPKQPNWTFKIAGRNAPESFISELAKYKIDYIGEVDDAMEFIDENNIMIVPLLAGSGMRIKIIEGMARGKCIVTTPIGAEGIEATNNKNIIIADNSENMIDSLNQLINNHEKINRISQEAIAFIESKFENSMMINKLANFYQTKLLK